MTAPRSGASERRDRRDAPVRAVAFLAAVAAVVPSACSEPAGEEPPFDPRDAGIPLGDAAGGYVDGDVPDGDKSRVDGGFATPDGGVLRADRFATSVESFTVGACGGFGASALPDVVLGPPVGGGPNLGGVDVLSLGEGGAIVLGFGDNAIVDGPGIDFLVFENAFYVGGDPQKPFAELGEVAVSDDGVTWSAFPCVPSASDPFSRCAGHTPTFSAPGNGISPVDPSAAGGDGFDLAALGVDRARFVRIQDRSEPACTSGPGRPSTAGFDLDAVSIVNAAIP